MTASLRRFLTQPSPPPAEERCELCSAPLPPEHEHVVQTKERALRCACQACALLFDKPGAGGGGYRRVPNRYLRDQSFALDDAQWDELQIPVRMAFFFHNSVLDKVVACYPSPAGATESELPMGAYDTGIGASRLAQFAQPDVEALLVRRGADSPSPGSPTPSECLLVPIDSCYRLVGLVRKLWKGFDGGTEAWEAIDGFFDGIRQRCKDAGG